VEEWIKYGYENSKIQGLVSWEELKEKKYYVVPTAADWEKDPAGLFKFYEDPENNPLGTPSGKLEFYSERIARHFPDDKERPAVPHWIEKSVMHDERLSSKRARRYPLLLMSNHPRWRLHAQCDDISWTREIPTCKVRGFDGYMYEPLWLHPDEAARRGIKHGDIVKISNERGAVLGGALYLLKVRPLRIVSGRPRVVTWLKWKRSAPPGWKSGSSDILRRSKESMTQHQDFDLMPGFRGLRSFKQLHFLKQP
jgi:anaerobic selenocysteine-containing dehydrogenase